MKKSNGSAFVAFAYFIIHHRGVVTAQHDFNVSVETFYEAGYFPGCSELKTHAVSPTTSGWYFAINSLTVSATRSLRKIRSAM